MYLIDDYCATPEQNYIRIKLKQENVGFVYSVVRVINFVKVVFVYKKTSNYHFQFIRLTVEEMENICESFTKF